MTTEKILDVISIYEQLMCDRLVFAFGDNFDCYAPPRRFDEIEDGTSVREWQHMLYMCDQMRTFLDEYRIDKVMRWLGFIQGWLWSSGGFTINELADHNRP